MPGRRDRLNRTRARPRGRVAARGRACVALLVLALAAAAAAQPNRPHYLPYAEFVADDTAQKVALKRAYNEAVQRYNQTLYDYHVTLERHDRLVELHNRSTDPAEQNKAREEANGLRGRLVVLRREVSSWAKTVDEAWARAAAGGVSITR